MDEGMVLGPRNVYVAEMAVNSPRIVRRFGPLVLGLSLLFLAVSDAGANCLAAWLCPPAAVEECDHAGDTFSAWEPTAAVCIFEARVDAASQKREGVLLFAAGTAAHEPAGESPVAASSSSFFSPSLPDRSAFPDLHRLRHPLLI